MILHTKRKLFFVSFLILFLELALIRFIPANIILIGYFANLILLGTFLGMGLGILLARRSINLFGLFPFLLVVLLGFVTVFRIEILVNSPDVIFFQDFAGDSIKFVPEVILPIVFILVAATFVPLGQEVGRLFRRLSPLTAYTIDIAGALVGILLFTLLSYFWFSAFVWFLVVGVVCFLLVSREHRFRFILSILAIFALVVISFATTSGSFWSPYYKITLTQIDNGSELNVNNIVHQFIADYERMPAFYFTQYKVFKEPQFRNVLIIGSGTGIDTAIALAKNPHVEHIDAVEIDPVIAVIGKKLNPNQPFQDPRVTVHVADGRSFLERTDKKYDLIIYALPDSLTITSLSSNVRLESFLFTKESFQKAREHLSFDGLFVLYNFYRYDWLVDKISLMLKEVFGSFPYVKTYGLYGKGASFLIGPRTEELTEKESLRERLVHEPIAAATDDWPFLYVKEKGIPPFYRYMLVAIAAIAIVATLLAMRKGDAKPSPFDFRFFFFGAAFLLLETKSLVTFSLLFGTTWLVNSLVFTSILLSILLANLVSMRVSIRPSFLYVLLFGLLFASYVVPSSQFLGLASGPRYILASTFYFSPIFLANLLFSQLFKRSQYADITFGSNMLGAVFGGIIEYSAMAIGYKALILVIALFYALSLIRLRTTR